MSTKLEIKRLQTGQLQLEWESRAGFQYDLEKSDDLVTWVTTGTYLGTGSKITAAVSAFGSKGFFRLSVTFPQGSEPKTWTVTYLDGSKVEVHWIPFGDPIQTGQYQIRRDGALIGVVTGGSDYFVDENVQSGKTYTYRVGYFS